MSTYRLSRVETNIPKPTVEQIEFDKDGKLAALRVESIGAISDDLIDPQIEKDVVRKLDRRIVPWLFGMFLLCFLDRANIGNAKIEGLAEDLHLTANQFNIALAVFFIPYILVEVATPTYPYEDQQLTGVAAKQYDSQKGWRRKIPTFPLYMLWIGMHMHRLCEELHRTPRSAILSWFVGRRPRSWNCFVPVYVLSQGRTGITYCLFLLCSTGCWCYWGFACIRAVVDPHRLI
jgi:hypothetical protein